MQRASNQPAERVTDSGVSSGIATAKRSETGPLRVVICGGGSGGLVLATALADKNGRNPNYAVTLVDPTATHVWKPLLHEFASGSADASFHEVAFIALARWHGFHFAQGPLEAIDREKREVLIGAAHDETGAELAPPRRLPYDVLVIAVGGVTNDFNIPGVRENAYFLDGAVDAERLHRRIVQACMRANHGLDAGVQHLDIAIVGGGATGVELAAELRATTRELLAYGLDNLDPEKFIRLKVINADPRLLLQLPERIASSVEEILHKLNVDVLNGQMVTEVTPGRIMTKSGESIASDITIWAAGVKAPGFLANIGGLETNRANQIVVTPTLQTTRDPNIFAIGDCAAAPWLGTDKLVPPRAQAAYQQARYLLKAIPRSAAGELLKPFSYNDLGSLVSLGGQSAVGTLMGLARGAGIRIEGFLAQMIYRWLYKRHQAALYGWWAVSLDSIGGWMRRVTRPQVKVH
ncbi:MULTISPECIES: NAD(P)/FAD-dependent oxidoreductase [Rhodomicrobium]|uniref:NAD(P)/FAD-dependent oxidoreductase n=1 Tax=Rhodomicrobium TaxID=1068 RepID=UPI000B4B169B|nr:MULTISPECIES: NAD(P)/FAD-dependent oxidoreductase [Rhodomicrobium]